MSIIDINGILSFFDLDTRKPDPSNPSKTIVGEHLSYERKVWYQHISHLNKGVFAVVLLWRLIGGCEHAGFWLGFVCLCVWGARSDFPLWTAH
jgi:hypothetical protein